jgi:hypothetical protein
MAPVVGAELGRRLGVAGVLPHRPARRRDVEPRPEHRVDLLAVVEVQVPAVEVLVEVGEMHVRPADEVPTRELRVAERLEVGDLRRPERVPDGRGEAQEELGPGRYQLGARDPGPHRHRLGQARPAREPSAHEPAPHAGCGEQPRQVVEQAPLGVVERVEVVAAQEDGDVVPLECGRLRVAREPHGLLEHPHLAAPGGRGPPVDRDRAAGLGGDEAVEVREAPGDRDAEAGGRHRVVGLERAERGLERAAGVALRRGLRLRQHSGGDDPVMERRHDHLHAVVAHDREAGEDVLLDGRGADRAADRSFREAVEQPVQPGRVEGGRAQAGRELLPRQPHRPSGLVGAGRAGASRAGVSACSPRACSSAGSAGGRCRPR